MISVVLYVIGCLLLVRVEELFYHLLIYQGACPPTIGRSWQDYVYISLSSHYFALAVYRTVWFLSFDECLSEKPPSAHRPLTMQHTELQGWRNLFYVIGLKLLHMPGAVHFSWGSNSVINTPLLSLQNYQYVVIAIHANIHHSIALKLYMRT